MGLTVYFLWPRTMIGPPSEVDSGIDIAYLQPPLYPQDSLLEEAWVQLQNEDYDKLDSTLTAIPDSSLSWMKGQVYRAFTFLDKASAGSAVKILEQQLPDSNWTWPLERNWFLGIARIQAGNLVEGYSVLDSVPSRLMFQADSMKIRLLPFLPDSLQ